MTLHTPALTHSSPRGRALAAGLAALLLSAGSVLASPDKIRSQPEGIVVVPDGPPASLYVEVWTDRGDGGRYCVGEPIRIYFRTNVDAWVAIVNTDTLGRTHRLFPNRWDREHFVRGGRVYELPQRGYRFEVEGPPGRETLHAVAALDRRDLRRAAERLLDPYRATGTPGRGGPSHHGVDHFADRIVIVPDDRDVAFDKASHRVRGGRHCGVRHWRPWWRR